MAEAERVLIAAKDGDLQTLRSLRRSAPFAADGFGATALHYAARTGRIDCVKWLVETAGISPKVRGRSGATPFHDAAAQGELECVKYFLATGEVDADTRDGSGHTVLHLSARFGRFDTVKWLIEKGNGNPRVKSRNYMTPVHFAACGGHLTCLELLVFKAGYSCVNDVATDGTTPLYLASQDGNLDCVKYLHSVDGKCNARARDGMLPIHAAAQNGHLDCIGYLMEKGQSSANERDGAGATPAHYAASQGHVTVLKWLNAKGDVTATDQMGGTPLHDAAEQGQFECIRYLVENVELNVQQKDKEGMTPLTLAEKNGHRRCLDYLKIAASKQAKAQKRLTDTKERQAVTENLTPTMKYPGKSLAFPTKREASFKTSLEPGFHIRERPERASLQLSINDKKNKPAVLKEIIIPPSVNTRDLNESTKPFPPRTQATVSKVLPSPFTKKPVREKQPLPSPPLLDILPPPPEFSEVTGEELLQPKEQVDLNENEANSEISHLCGPFESTSVEFSANVTNQDDCSVIVKVDSFSNKASTSSHAISESKDEHTKTTVRNGISGQPIGYKNQNETSEGRHEGNVQSLHEELVNVLPLWKRQILMNRVIKEKARERVEREKREIKQRKWSSVPSWKIPLISKKEEERLKEEQRWVGMPEWKKNLLRKRGSGLIYRDYHKINAPLRRKVSFKSPDISDDEEFDGGPRTRGLPSPD